MILHDKNLRSHLIVISVLLFIEILLFLLFTPFKLGEELLFFTPDSETYLECGTEFFNFTKQGTSEFRPFLYPLFLNAGLLLLGAQFVGILQLIFWFISAILLFLAIYRFTNRYILAYIGLVLFMLNFSILVYSFHALTETLTILLLCYLCYYLSKHAKQAIEVKHFLQLVLLLSILTVIKPLFWYPFLVVLLVGIVYFFKHFLKNKIYIFKLFLITFPVCLQLIAMKVKYNYTGISKISAHTMNKYFLSQTYGYVNELTYDEAYAAVLKLTGKEKTEFVKKNFKFLVKRWYQNIDENVGAIATGLDFKPKYSSPELASFGTQYNSVHQSFYLFFFLAFLLYSTVRLIKKQLILHWTSLFIGILLYYTLFAIGMSFWQGDRMVLISIPLCIVLYLYLLSNFFEYIKRKFIGNK